MAGEQGVEFAAIGDITAVILRRVGAFAVLSAAVDLVIAARRRNNIFNAAAGIPPTFLAVCGRRSFADQQGVTQAIFDIGMAYLNFCFRIRVIHYDSIIDVGWTRVHAHVPRKSITGYNEDGYDDFAVPNSYSATSMSVILNNGDGTYGAPHTYGIAQTGYEIEVEDFNSDGHDDFAVRGGSSYMVSLGKGDGTFYPSVNYPTPNGGFEAGTHGDFNGDGAIDLAYPSGSSVVVLTNDNADSQNLAGAVSFRVSAPATTTSGSVLPMTIEAVDSNGNIATGYRGTAYISSSDPLASTATGYAFNPNDAGIPYIFTAADGGSHTFTGAIKLVTGGLQTVSVSGPNMQTGTVSVNVTGQVTGLQISGPANTVAGDSFDITVSAIDSSGAMATGYSSQIHFASSDALAGLPADYTFTPADAGTHTFTVTLKQAGSKFVSAQEVGGRINGVATISVAPQVTSNLVLASASGAIGVTRPVTMIARDQFGNFTPNYTGTVQLTSSDPAAVFPAQATFSAGIATVNVKFLTVGVQTLTATDITSPTITGTLSSNATPPVPASFVVTGYPSSVAGTTNNFTVKVVDTIGQTASGFQGTVFFSSSDVQAGLPASYTFTDADAGTHTFSATLKTAGVQSITVMDTSTASAMGTQAGIAVSASPVAASLSVVGFPATTAGAAQSLSVTVRDAFGNVSPGFRGTVSFSSSDAKAVLPANYTFTAADAGVHTFSATLKSAGSQSITVRDAANSVVVGIQSGIQVSAAAAATFVMSASSTVTQGVGFKITVTAYDAYGNIATGYRGKVTLTSTDSKSGKTSYSFSSKDNGVATLSYTLNTLGNQTLKLVDELNTALSASLVVNVVSKK